MIDTKALYGIIVSRGYTQKDIAYALNIAPKTFYDKMKKGVFGSDEIDIMIRKLDISDPVAIFFTDKVT